jgi:hypothetical protein
MGNTHDPQVDDQQQPVPAADPRRSRVLEYGMPPPPRTPGVTGWLAVACTALAWFWLGVRWSEAWVRSAAFGVGGCLAATVGLCSSQPRGWGRAVLIACLLAGAVAACVAVLG